MRALLSTYGSRGDVEPLAGLGVALQALGVDVRICAPPDAEFTTLLARAGVPLMPAFSPVREWVSEASKQPPGDISKRAADIVAAQFDAISAAAEGCDVLVATGLFPSTAAARSVAEQRGIRYVYTAYCPMFLPSQHQRPFAYPGHLPPAELTDNRALWALDVQSMNAIFGAGVNRLRASIGLSPVDNVRDHVFTQQPWLAADPTLSPWLPTDLCTAVQTGAWLLPDQRPLPTDVLAFLDAGPAPVYVGFGSMPMQTAKDAGPAAIAAIRAQGRRAIIHRGWAELDSIDDRDDCLVVGDVNQQALFPRVAAVVHHGGAGTTTTATRCAVPQVIVPQLADQPYWADRVAALGIGVAHDGPLATLESLSAALQIALKPETRARARIVAGMIRSDGATLAAQRLLETIDAAAGQGGLTALHRLGVTRRA